MRFNHRNPYFAIEELTGKIIKEILVTVQCSPYVKEKLVSKNPITFGDFQM